MFIFNFKILSYQPDDASSLCSTLIFQGSENCVQTQPCERSRAESSPTK